ncbi:MAG TPA: bifunctional demethylmenaquinone methyltransferase/2-methoxy-6-polyprenyl-1,4-benzoquinol methylase UbiE [Solirubrobacteraceae bacterium]|jgi:demethylmenaquinone methyltransferase/2-methoxy-6-polyprenyl-1,4-benzoquinol methylase|nr:bifunctional demethylmenaquinone methyltransferase/2-methoxy-6-polyprenyl-1,4-benzoquinol methylase UbiE [Solirubrobacteraceae bacterium]
MTDPSQPRPESGTLAEPQVRAMFDRIAGVYDRTNSVMTAGLHHKWRRRAVELTQVGAGSRVLDVATGTGDLAFALAETIGPTGQVVGADFSEQMLKIARNKAAGGSVGPASAPVQFEQANALLLPHANAEFDAATVGFGVRNFSDLDQGLRELARVVRPGGRVVILEMTTPQKPPLSTFFRFWFDRVVPVLGRAAGDSDAYTYLPNSVRRFPGPDELAGRMAGVGFGDIRYVLTAGGIIALHVGTVVS